MTLDLLWWLDVAISFRTAVRRPEEGETSSLASFLPSKVAWQYAKGPFAVDALAGLPLYWMHYTGELS